MKGYNAAHEADVRDFLSKMDAARACVTAQAESERDLWARRIATDPDRWTEINGRYVGKKLKNKRADFRRRADKILALDFNINGERYDF